MIKSLIVALSMYSSIPMPHTEWTQKNMQYALCFFPVIGLIQGALIALLCWASSALHVSSVLFGVLAVICVKLLTGGIHMDGYCDTMDALASNGDREKMLDIMKDPHVGAFGAMALMLYLFLNAALFHEVVWSFHALAAFAAISTLSRALSGIAVVGFPCAKNSGLAYLFANSANKTSVRNILIAVGGVAFVVAWLVAGWLGLASASVVCAVFVFYYLFTQKKFGGITGDTAGWFVCTAEASALAALVLVQKIAFVLGGG